LDSTLISSETSGIVDKILFTNGQFVKAGELLLVLGNKEQQADLAAAKATAHLRELNYQRLTKLAKSQAISQQQLDQAKAELAQANSQVALAQAALDKTLIKAPFAGYLGARQVSLGSLVQSGQALVTLVRRDPLYIDYQLPEKAIANIKLGQTLQLTSDTYPDLHFTAQVTYIDPQIDTSAKTVSLLAQVDNPDNLLYPGMFMHVQHQLDLTHEALVIPESSLIASPTGFKVFVVNGDNIAQQRAVELGDYYYGTVAVKAGLTAGEQVISQGPDKLNNGAQVLPQQQLVANQPAANEG
jgi:membrane fusion protein (multidrug efflux system)